MSGVTCGSTKTMELFRASGLCIWFRPKLMFDSRFSTQIRSERHPVAPDSTNKIITWLTVIRFLLNCCCLSGYISLDKSIKTICYSTPNTVASTADIFPSSCAMCTQVCQCRKTNWCCCFFSKLCSFPTTGKPTNMTTPYAGCFNYVVQIRQD